MGCWNKTCGISQFPIHDGDEVVTFIIVQNEFGNRETTPSYANQLWNVIPLPIYGEYNDYGWMDVTNGQENKLAFLKEFYKDSVVVNKEQVDRVQMCYPSLKGKGKGPFDSWEALGDSIHGDAFLLKNRFNGERYPKNLMISSFMISKKVWDALTATYTVDYPKEKIYTKADLVKGVEKFFEYIEKQKAEFEVLKAKSEDSSLDEDAKKVMSMLAFELIHGVMSSTKYVNEVLKDKSYNNPIAGVIHFISDRSGSESPVIDLKQLTNAKVVNADDAAGMYLLWCAMSVLRKSWFPQSGEGSQCGIEAQHVALVKVMGEMIEFEKTRWD